jgi:hypothetical protein
MVAISMAHTQEEAGRFSNGKITMKLKSGEQCAARWANERIRGLINPSRGPKGVEIKKEARLDLSTLKNTSEQ